MASTANAALQEQALRHLWLHFTAMSGLEAERLAVIERGEGPYVVRHRRQALPRLPVRPVHRADRLLVRRGARARRRWSRRAAAVLHELDVRPPAARSSWRPSSPRSRPRASAAASSSPAARRPSRRRSSWPASTTTPRGEPQRRKVIARKIAYHGTTYGALSLTGITGPAHAVRAAHGRASATSRTPTSTAASTAPTRAAATCSAPTRSPRRSSSRGPRPSPW